MNLKPYPEYKDSGVAWLGDVPKHWEVHRGKWHVSSKKRLNANYECRHILSLTLRGVVDNNSDSPEGLVPKDYNTYQIFEKDDLVFKLIDLENYRTSRVGLVHRRGIMSPAYIRATLKTHNNPKYYYYLYYSWYLDGVYNKIGAGVRSTLSSKDLLDLLVSIPPLEEQSQIALFLDHKTAQIARFIKAKKRMIELLKEQKQVIINDAVTGKIDVTTGKPYPKYKNSGEEWLGQVPEGWGVRRLKDVVKTNQEALSEKTSPSYEFNYLDISSVKTGYLISKPQRLLFENAPSRARRIVRKGDTIVSTVRTYLRSVLHIENECDDLIVSTGFAVLTPNKIIDQRYIGYLLRSGNFIDSVIRNSIGVSYPAISETKLGTLNILLPSSFIEQQQIVSYIETKTATLDLAISRTEREIALMQEYCTRLISDVVTGKIDVRDITVPDAVNEHTEEADEDIEEISEEINEE